MEFIQLPNGFSYYVSLPSKPGLYPLSVYLCGSQEPVAKSEFVNKYVPKNKESSICVAICMPAGRSGWQFPFEGMFAGTWILRYIKDTYTYNGDFFGAGWSAGGDYSIWASIADFLTAFCICAGSGDYKTTLAFGEKKIPARHYHGDKDESTATNYPTYTKGKKTALEVYKMGEFDKADPLSNGFYSIPGGNHASAPAKAFSDDTDLMKWFIKHSKVVTPPAPQPEPPQSEVVTEITIVGDKVVFKSATMTVTLP